MYSKKFKGPEVKDVSRTARILDFGVCSASEYSIYSSNKTECETPHFQTLTYNIRFAF